VPRKLRLQHSIFRDETAARLALENLRWPEGVRCPRPGCGSTEVAKIGGEKQTHRNGLFNCRTCRRQFTVTVGTVMHRSKVPLTKWMQVAHLEDTAGLADNSWQMASATGLTHKTIEKMRARIFAAVGKYDGPNTVFGRRVGAYVRSQRPTSYQNPPKLHRRLDGEGLNYRPYYAWRWKNPLGKPLEARGVLAALDNANHDDLVRTERLLLQLLDTAPVPLRRKRRKSKKLPEAHVGWLRAGNRATTCS
jgi:transposase-like protein